MIRPSAAAAVDVINGFDVAIVQHEHGIYAGPDGQDLVPLLYALRVPAIVVLHTVLAQPTARRMRGSWRAANGAQQA